MNIRIYDSHRGMRKENRERLQEFFSVAKNISVTEAEKQVDFCEWYSRNFAVSWFEVIAFSDKKVIGYLRCLRNPSDVTEWYIGDVFVRKEYRKRGIASRLYYKAIDELYSYERAETVIATVDRRNAESLGLHKKMGFVDTGLVETFDIFLIPETETKHMLKLYCE